MGGIRGRALAPYLLLAPGIAWLILFFVVFCLVASFFFSGSETALTVSSRATMLRLAKDGDP